VAPRLFLTHDAGEESTRPDVIDDEVRQQVVHLFALVGESIVGATHALLSNDRELAKSVVQRDIEIDGIVNGLLGLVESAMTAPEAPSAADREELLRLARILPEIERNGDLAEHVARRAARGLGVEMSPRSRGLVERMGEVAGTIWRAATDAIVDGDDTAVHEIEEIDDELDDLHVSLNAELTSGSMALPVAVEVAMIARFYERFGDHCVNLARRQVPRGD
jgi:phosphate transport system protein